uniref:DYW domain-containing protein n=1 Tax=Kalanchoe fedtschenkoi TaxID=63787 RepID=A0A7N0ZQZ9_KALFE
MDLPLSRFQTISFDRKRKDICGGLPIPLLDPEVLKGDYFPSGFRLKLNTRKWRRPFAEVSRSLMEQLKPRPKPRPSPEVENVNVDAPTVQERYAVRRSSRSGLCCQIEKLVLCNKYQEALDLFDVLEGEQGCEIGSETYDALVNACIGLRSIRGVKRVFGRMIATGFRFDQYMRNRVLLMHVKCGMMLDARKLFDEMPDRNVVSWNTVIGGLVDSGEYMESFQLFLEMWHEFPEADSRLLAVMLRAAAGLGVILVGTQLHSVAVKMNLGRDIFVACALIDMYSKCGSIEDALCVFDEMPEKTTVGWNTIIAGYALHGFAEEALELYYEMQDSGVKMDHFTFSIIVRICTRLGSLEHARQAHAGLVRHGFGLDVVASMTLVDFYSKWGRVEDARHVFDRMPRKNVISWNALIGGYGNHGRGVEAVEVFNEMLRKGMSPNHVTFLAVLSACRYSGLSEFGWEIFESMTRDHKIKPRAMHYACMIELLGREGHLDEALGLIEDAPFEPTVNMWAALLTACRIHKDLELAKYAAEKLYGMEPEKLSNYVLLLNIYNSSGQLKEAAAVLQTLKRRGLRMLPVCTWIEIKKQPHVFLSGDKCHAQTEEIYAKLDSLMLEIATKHGYQPENHSLLPDVDEQEERMRLYHSEKLAIAFGLINTVHSTPLQLVQSHRMCGDCHKAVKLIAMVCRRVIVIRDGSRFHHFEDGKCSCGDYW